MKLHPEEYRLACAYDSARGFEEFSPEQLKLIMDRGRDLFKWFKNHLILHNLINATLVASILVTDGVVLLVLPHLFLTGVRKGSLLWILIASAISGGLHSWLMYSLGLYSLHEGAAHNLIFCGTGSVGRLGQFLGRNLCRLTAGEPGYYAECHMAHHAKFGTEHDSEFLNFVIPQRYWLTFLPLAAIVNFSDFIIHRPLTYTKGRVISGVVGALYTGLYGFFIYRSFGLLFMLLVMLVVMPHFGFYIDRSRQFTEHNLMPLENRNGARSFGVGFWGLILGGGPWGQPCHLSHHLVPSIPWYQQIRLHFFIRGLLTERQKEQFLLKPFVGFPQLLWRVVSDANRFAGERGIPGTRTQQT